MSRRSKKDKKHKKEKKEKKSRHRRDKHAAPRAVDAPAGNAVAHAAGTKSSPAAPAHDADALRLSAKSAGHVAQDAADSVSDSGSDYGPTPLLAAVGDVGYWSPSLCYCRRLDQSSPRRCLTARFIRFQIRIASARGRG
jgi:hypothetical protein